MTATPAPLPFHVRQDAAMKEINAAHRAQIAEKGYGLMTSQSDRILRKHGIDPYAKTASF